MKEAADAVGGLNRLADLVDIPRRTLGDQLSGKTEPKMSLLVATAGVTGFSITWLATGQGPKRDDERQVPVDIDAELLERLARIASEVHHEVGQRLPGERATLEAAMLYNELAGRVADMADADEVEATLPLLRFQLKKRLTEAAAGPGTGKREAS